MKWDHNGWGFHWPDDLPPAELRHLDFIERRLEPKYIRATVALIAYGISPYRHDQLNDIVKLAKLMKLSSERLGSCFGYLPDGRHLFDTMMDAEAERRVGPRIAAGLCLWRLLTGVQLPELRISKIECELVTRGVM